MYFSVLHCIVLHFIVYYTMYSTVHCNVLHLRRDCALVGSCDDTYRIALCRGGPPLQCTGGLYCILLHCVVLHHIALDRIALHRGGHHWWAAAMIGLIVITNDPPPALTHCLCHMSFKLNSNLITFRYKFKYDYI